VLDGVAFEDVAAALEGAMLEGRGLHLPVCLFVLFTAWGANSGSAAATRAWSAAWRAWRCDERGVARDDTEETEARAARTNERSIVKR
jgi:hypothetical protein